MTKKIALKCFLFVALTVSFGLSLVSQGLAEDWPIDRLCKHQAERAGGHHVLEQYCTPVPSNLSAMQTAQSVVRTGSCDEDGAAPNGVEYNCSCAERPVCFSDGSCTCVQEEYCVDTAC